jgi:hypothetical protein
MVNDFTVTVDINSSAKAACRTQAIVAKRFSCHRACGILAHCLWIAAKRQQEGIPAAQWPANRQQITASA